jgi:hypothetical protein
MASISFTSPEIEERKTTAKENADKAMKDYEKYLNDLYKCLPDAYAKLKQFMENGNCKCRHEDEDGQKIRSCNENGENWSSCVCSNVEHCCEHCSKGGRGCITHEVENTVRIYDINPKAKKFNKFLGRQEYHIGRPQEHKGLNFKGLQETLYGDTTYNEQKQKQKPDRDADDQRNDLWDGKDYHVITVSHLSPDVARLLGARFDIPADFFNRYLPGTEAISGRLISRLPSSIQIDLDELYESTKEFEDWFGPLGWCGRHLVSDGHNFIQKAIRREFLFRVGWDYFPVHKEDFKSSLKNYRSSSGYEVLMQDEFPKNLFQFNLTHRISIYSKPVKHPRIGL